MIVANLATYPPREKNLAQVVEAILPQVDMMNIVFNEYGCVPEKYKNTYGINPIVPKEDMKDTGKFLPDTSPEDYVLLIDDDIDYPKNYVSEMIYKFNALPGDNFVAGLYASIYEKPSPGIGWTAMKRFAAFYLSPRKIARYRVVFSFNRSIKFPILVDQLGTGTTILRGEKMPPFDFMRGSQKFVDVRFARWCFEHNISMIALPRDSNWLSWEDDEHSIFKKFTVTDPICVSREIWSFAFKRSSVGKRIYR